MRGWKNKKESATVTVVEDKTLTVMMMVEQPARRESRESREVDRGQRKEDRGEKGKGGRM